jgi:predicted transposase/invertase (TIGR01784 family)
MAKKVIKVQIPVIGKYIDLTTDFGFKRIFGEENVDLLINFLNNVLKLVDPIVSLQYTNIEHKGRIKRERGAFFDLLCITSNEEHILIEVQNAPQLYFVDRILYYLSFMIQKQAKRGKWNFKLSKIYSINILNHTIDDDDKRYFYQVQLMDVETKQVFYDKLSLYFVELPKVPEKEDKLQTTLDWWFYLLRHLPECSEIPEKLKENEIFKRLFEEAEVANMTSEEYDLYVESLKVKNMYTPQDFINDWKEALKESRKENKILTGRNTKLSRDNAAKDAKIAQRDAKIAQLEQRLKQAGLAYQI